MVLLPQMSAIYVFDDNAVYWYPVQLNSGDSYSNSQCTVSGASYQTEVNSTTLGLNLWVTFLPAFVATSYFDEYVADQNGLSTGWVQLPGASITVTAPGLPAISSISIVPSTVPSGGSASVTVTLTAPAPSGGAAVALSSSNTSALPNATCTVAASQSSNACGVTAGTVSSPTQVTVTATYNSSSQSQGVSVEPAVRTVIATSVAGLSVTVDGEGYPAPQPFLWAAGSNHTIFFPAPQSISGVTNTQYVFANWSDGGLASHTITVPSSPSTYTANVTTQYLLITSASLGGAISPAPPANWYSSGWPVTVTATASAGYTFTGFTGGLTGTTSPQTLTMSQPLSVRAQFTYGYTISGQVTSAGAALAGVTVNLTGTSSAQTTTQASGVYSFPVQTGTYTVTPSLQGYSFTPVYISNIAITTASQSGENFAGQVSGPSVTGFAPTSAAPGASVTITGTNFGSTQGSVQFGTVSATVTNWSTAGTSISVTAPSSLAAGTYNVVVTSAAGVPGAPASFVVTAAGTYTISGTVSAQNGCPVPNVTVSLTGGGTATTGANGAYSFAVMSGSYTVTPSESQFTFNPPYWEFSSLTGNETTANFVGTGPPIPTREYIRLGGRVIAIANCGAQ
jgi:hypothetical protein